MGRGFLGSTVKEYYTKWWSGRLSMDNMFGIENRILCYYCKLLNSGHPIPPLKVYLNVVTYGFV